MEPALTKEEWAEYLRVDVGYNFDLWEECGTALPLGRQEAAALALHGQPFGFRTDDVDLLEAIADHAPDEPLSDADRDQLRNLAERLSALLPPREETP